MINGKKYKVGMYGGAFNPLHLGHLECMIKAAALCEELFIVISYRNHRSDVDVKVKIRWVDSEEVNEENRMGGNLIDKIICN